MNLCNGSPVDIELVNRSQFEVLQISIDGEPVVTEPLAVGESAIVTGFAESSMISFRRERADSADDVVVTSSAPVCARRGDEVWLFDQSFRIVR